ncbi:MAG: ATP phosphoribosyltransferase regulatory subunit [Oscillospiraceae bacterium]|jgi:ATP phosphoribosyltransferase regulatory subunit|nr:ATP phosphoribosyltransferase regulatory subunit [Oscillospiraceae bacterium]
MNQSKEKITVDQLQSLYARAGFRPYHMRKFEEYALYLENKRFLNSESLITFHDRNGKVLALKPDVTLSIVKNTTATKKSPEKLYYTESVYRLDPQSREYREINQMGLELLGEVDNLAQAEVCLLALESLAAIDDDYVLSLSHMGIISAILDAFAPDSPGKQQEILTAFRMRSPHAVRQMDEKLSALVGLRGGIGQVVEKCLSCVQSDTMREACAQLLELDEILGQQRISMDLSVLQDLYYYNGIVFQGYVPKVHRAVLSGGRYDRLVENRGGIGAMGFAVYLNDLSAYQAPADYSEEIVLQYDEKDAAHDVLAKAQELRAQGSAVRLEKRRGEKNA